MKPLNTTLCLSRTCLVSLPSDLAPSLFGTACVFVEPLTTSLARQISYSCIGGQIRTNTSARGRKKRGSRAAGVGAFWSKERFPVRHVTSSLRCVFFLRLGQKEQTNLGKRDTPIGASESCLGSLDDNSLVNYCQVGEEGHPHATNGFCS